MHKTIRSFLIAILFSMPLMACQTTLTQINDCKVGDWNFIGNKDGSDGLTPQYDDRRKFCSYVDSDKIKAESGTQYQQGWEQGNHQYWLQLGQKDGRAGLAISQWNVQLQSEKIVKNKTPLNKPAYDTGWSNGNADYWYDIGDQDGKAGLPSTQENVRATQGMTIGFNLASYQHGWTTGNYSHWSQLGYQDAHDGIPATALKDRAQDARAKGVTVRPDAYKEAWDKEIIEYWRRLGWSDATEGRDANTRRADAKARGLPFLEAEYQQQWQQRLVEYWREAGNSDGFGRPNLLEDRMRNARRDNVFVIPQTRDLYNQAWTTQNATYCGVDNAFAFGRNHQVLAFDVCIGQQQNRARRAWLGGQDYAQLEQKLNQLNSDYAYKQDRYNEARSRIEHVEREIRRDKDDKNRPVNNDTAEQDRRRDHERHELWEFLQRMDRQLDEMRGWRFQFEQQMQQIQRDIYRD